MQGGAVVLDAERFDRLISALESVANSNNRLSQQLAEKERKKTAGKAARVRKAPKRSGVVTDKAEAAARALVARIKAGR